MQSTFCKQEKVVVYKLIAYGQTCVISNMKHNNLE